MSSSDIFIQILSAKSGFCLIWECRLDFRGILIQMADYSLCLLPMSFSIPEGYSHSDNIVKSFNFLVTCFSYVFSQIWNYILDPLISLISGTYESCNIILGKTKPVRILCNSVHTSKMTSQIRDCIMDQAEFSEVSIVSYHDYRFVSFCNAMKSLMLIMPFSYFSRQQKLTSMPPIIMNRLLLWIPLIT